MRQMTFDIPEEVAERFTSEVPAAEQSSVVPKLLLRRRPTPKFTDEQWDAVCNAANDCSEEEDNAWLAEMAKHGSLETSKVDIA